MLHVQLFQPRKHVYSNQYTRTTFDTCTCSFTHKVYTVTMYDVVSSKQEGIVMNTGSNQICL